MKWVFATSRLSMQH